MSSVAAFAWMASSPRLAAAQVLPFFEDFESTNGETYSADTASLIGAPEWSFDQSVTQGRLRMRAGTGYARSGIAAATMDSSTDGILNTNFLILTLDLSAFSVTTDQILLDFHFMHHGEESHANDRVWVRGSNTSAFVEVVNLNTLMGQSGQYRTVVDINVSAALAAAGQNFSSTFQVRFGQQDDFRSTSPTLTDGFTFDDIFLRRNSSVDTGVTAIVSPEPDACGSSTQDVVVQVTNFGFLPAVNVPVTVQVGGDFTEVLTGTLQGPLAQNQSGVLALGPIDTAGGGNLQLTAFTSMPGDEDPNNDDTAAAASVTSLVLSLAAEPACPGSPALLRVEPAEPNVTYGWFNALSGGSLIGTGSTFATPPLTDTASFFAARLSQPESLGALDQTIGAGSYHTIFENLGLAFNVTATTTIRVVHVIPREPGSVTVRIRNGAGELVDAVTQEVTVPDVKTPIQLDVELPPGNGYKIDAEGTNIALFRNTAGAAFPYEGSNLTITGPTSGLGSFYYYFYDWLVDGAACGAERTPVVATVDINSCDIDMGLTAETPEGAIAGRDVTFTVTVANGGPDFAHDVVVTHDEVPGATFVSNEGDCRTPFPCRLGVIAGGEQRTISTTFRIGSDFAPGTNLASTFTVNHATPEAAPGNDSLEVSTSVGTEADLSLSMRANGGDVADDAEAVFLLEVSNAGPSDARDVIITDQLPAGAELAETVGCAEDPAGAPTCTVGTLAAGDTAQVLVKVRVGGTGELRNAAHVSSSTPEIGDGDEVASAVFDVVEAPGCGCRAGASDASSQAVWLLALAGLAAVFRRRRRV